MIRRLAALGSLITLLVAGSSAPAEAAAPSVDAYLHTWQHDNRLPGVAVAIVDGADVETRLLGNDGDGDAVTATTPFLVGSVAKTFTSTIVLQLVDEGRLTLDDKAQTHLPWLDHDATVRQLLDHTAGYSAADGVAVSERYRVDETVTAVAQRLEHTGRIGQYQYNSADYLVLGALIERLAGHSYADELNGRITGPAGMTDTRADGPAVSVPPGSRPWWGIPAAYDPGPEPSGAPYGYIVSTLDDLVAYARAHLAARLISSETRAIVWSEQVPTGDKHGYGLGWSLDARDGTTRVHHTGATPGYFAHIMLMPQDDRAVVVLANGYSESRAPSLAAAAADLDRLDRGEPATPAPGDALLTALPWVALVPVALALATLVGLGLRRPRGRPGKIVLVAASLLLIGLLALLPRLLGMTWHVVRVWAPDVAAAAMAGLIGWTLVLLLLVAHERKPLRRNQAG